MSGGPTTSATGTESSSTLPPFDEIKEREAIEKAFRAFILVFVGWILVPYKRRIKNWPAMQDGYFLIKWYNRNVHRANKDIVRRQQSL